MIFDLVLYNMERKNSENYFVLFSRKLLECPKTVKDKEVMYDFIGFYLKLIDVTIKKVTSEKEKFK